MATPVVFIHGLWLHADSWKPWVELFRAAGYDPIAPRWPGEPATVAEANAQPERLANVGIDDVVEHYGAIIQKLPAKPIVIGHSFGGLVALRSVWVGTRAVRDVAEGATADVPIQGGLPVEVRRLSNELTLVAVVATALAILVAFYTVFFLCCLPST